ncbi:hypothetical protein BGW42_000984 [Actinomortierella wolfii]|nr:hypothetical protein BGW42_000984 [Actinomortierella wolfii]
MLSHTAISKDMFDKWTEDIDKARKNLGIQGTSVAVIYRGEIVYAKGFGKRNDIDTFTPEVYQKSGFTAAAIGELVAKNKAKWDVPVHEYLPEFKLKDDRLTSEITFVDLLSHRTCLPSLDLAWHHRSESRLDLIKTLKHVELQAPFRTEWIYSNGMVTVAGEIAAVIAGQPYDELVTETVLRPLGMKKSGFSNKIMATKPNFSLPYSCKNFEAAQEGQTHRVEFDTSCMTTAPAGDMHSNVIELANWAKVVMHNGELDGEQVLDKKTIEQLLTAYNIMERSPRGPEFSIGAYGLCLMMDHYKGHLTIHHSGSVFGYRSNLVFFSDDDLAVINLSNNNVNQLPIWLPYYIADDVLQLPKTCDWLFEKAVSDTKRIYKKRGDEDLADLEREFPPQIKDKPATRDLSDFAGKYTHPVAGEISFKLVDKTKTSDKNDEQSEVALEFQYIGSKGLLDHYHFDSFRFRVLDATFGPFAALVTFITGENGLVERCRMFVKGEFHYVFTKAREGADSLATKDA